MNNLHIYELAMNIGEKIWKMVNKWDYFAKETIGKKLVQATDSVACRLNENSENKNNSDDKDKLSFIITDLNETKTLLAKAVQRKLIDEREYNNISTEINVISFFLNKYAVSIRNGKTELKKKEIIELKEYNRNIYERNYNNPA